MFIHVDTESEFSIIIFTFKFFFFMFIIYSSHEQKYDKCWKRNMMFFYNTAIQINIRICSSAYSVYGYIFTFFWFNYFYTRNIYNICISCLFFPFFFFINKRFRNWTLLLISSLFSKFFQAFLTFHRVIKTKFSIQLPVRVK